LVVVVDVNKLERGGGEKPPQIAEKLQRERDGRTRRTARLGAVDEEKGEKCKA